MQAIDVGELSFQQFLGKLHMLSCEPLSLLKVFLHPSGEWWKFLQLPPFFGWVALLQGAPHQLLSLLACLFAYTPKDAYSNSSKNS